MNAVNKVDELCTEQLKDIVQTPVIPGGYYSGWAQYTITLKNKEQRDSLQKHLKEQGILSMVYYPRPLHTQTVFADLNQDPVHFPNSKKTAETVLSLPMHPYLQEDAIKMTSAYLKGFVTAQGV